MKRDIQDRADLQRLVAVFHERLLQEEEFRHLFLEVMQVDMLHHLDVVVDFWDTVLFRAEKYKADILAAHLKVNQQYGYRLNETHFSRWLTTFQAVVDEHFEGPTAKAAKEKAVSVAIIIKMKLDNLEKRRREINN